MIVVNQSRALSPRIAYQVYLTIVSLRDALRAAAARRETRNALAGLSETALADIGLTRAMVDAL